MKRRLGSLHQSPLPLVKKTRPLVKHPVPSASLPRIPTGFNHPAQGWTRSGLPWDNREDTSQPQRKSLQKYLNGRVSK
jgi:hypothetical protein